MVRYTLPAAILTMAIGAMASDTTTLQKKTNLRKMTVEAEGNAGGNTGGNTDVPEMLPKQFKNNWLMDDANAEEMVLDGIGPANDLFPMVSAYGDCDANEYQGDTDILNTFAPVAISNFPVQSDGGRQYIWNENGKAPDEPWTFMKNFDWDYSNFRQSNWYWMETLTASDGVSYIEQLMEEMGKTKILFFVHGWNSGLEGNFCTIFKMSRDLPDHLIIPVIWNTDRGETQSVDYRYDRVVTAPQAGTSLAELYGAALNRIDFPKSWVCHSMGCYVTQHFAAEVNDSSAGFSGEKFENLFMVASDVRYDLFDEYPLGSGDGENSCFEGEWNTPDDSTRIPDCRPGCGNALVNMVNGLVRVYYYIDDYALGIRESRLSTDFAHTWPISVKALGRYGNGSGSRAQIGSLAADCTKVHFVDAGSFLADEEHSYQVTSQMLEQYNNPPEVQCDVDVELNMM